MKIEFLMKLLMEEVEKRTDKKIEIKIGKYSGEYYLGDGKYTTIHGDLLMRANYPTLFKIEDGDIVDEFDIVEDNAIISF